MGADQPGVGGRLEVVVPGGEPRPLDGHHVDVVDREVGGGERLPERGALGRETVDDDHGAMIGVEVRAEHRLRGRVKLVVGGGVFPTIVGVVLKGSCGKNTSWA